MCLVSCFGALVGAEQEFPPGKQTLEDWPGGGGEECRGGRRAGKAQGVEVAWASVEMVEGLASLNQRV